MGMAKKKAEKEKNIIDQLLDNSGNSHRSTPRQERNLRANNSSNN
jgi:SspJ family small acid-soluble spore protein